MSPAPRTSFGASESTRLHTPPLLTGRIAELLAGKKIGMTGVTGFIGAQMLW